jgi:protein-tyrosine phosphatase
MNSSAPEPQGASAAGAPLANADVLFLCTGNYYRSRFAEEYFNHMADKQSLGCRAFSLGFQPSTAINPGTMSPYALRALQARGIQPVHASRPPTQVRPEDFLRHKCCIALSESEHRPMMVRLFPQFAHRVRYWQVEDLSSERSETATARIETEIHRLLLDFE